MADDTVAVFVLHRAVMVSRDSGRAAVATTKGAVYFVGDFGEAKDSTVPYDVREADEVEARVEQLRLKAAVDERVEQLRMQAAINRRVEQLRMQADRVDD
jgi:hypothetical protein